MPNGEIKYQQRKAEQKQMRESAKSAGTKKVFGGNLNLAITAESIIFTSHYKPLPMKKSHLILLFTFLLAAFGILSFMLVPGRRPLMGIRFFYQLSGWLSPLNLSIFNSWGKWYT